MTGERDGGDWDRDAWRARFDSNAFRYDNNGVFINWIGHPGRGSMYYLLGRANGLSAVGSVTLCVTYSFLWEILFELRDRTSINDAIVTPAAGMALGAFWHRLAEYLAGAP